MNKILNYIKVVAIVVLCMPGVLLPFSRTMQVSKSYPASKLIPEQRVLLAKKAVMMKAKFKEKSELSVLYEKQDLTLLSIALDKIANGTFDQYYYGELKPEYDASLKDKNVQSRLRTLINLAEKQPDKSLSAFLATYFFPTDIQKMLMVPQIIEPVIEYLKNEIYKKGNIYPTILSGHEGLLKCVDMTPDGKIIATAAEGNLNNIIMWNGQTGEKLRALKVGEGSIKDMSISNDGSKVMAIVTIHFSMQEFFNEEDITQAQKKEIILLYDVSTGRLIKKIEQFPDNNIVEAAFSEKGNRIIVTTVKNIVAEITDPNALDEKAHISIMDAMTGNTIIVHQIMNTYPVVTINPQGDTVIIRSAQDLILYDLKDGKELKKLEGPTSKIYDVSYSQDGNKIIANESTTSKTFIWNGNSGSLITDFDDIGSNVFFYANASQVVSLKSNSILFWDIASKTKLLEISTDKPVNYIQVSSKASLVAASYNDGTIDIWSAATAEKIHTLKHVPSDHFVFINCSADGKRLNSRSWSDDGRETALLWSTETGKQINALLAKSELLSNDENFLTIVSPDEKNVRNFVLWKSLSNSEEKGLKELETINIAQAQFLYQLYKAKLKNNILYISKSPLFSQEMQSIITEYLNTEKIVKQEKENTLMQPVAEIKQQLPIQQKQAVKTWWQWLTGQ